ncbi:MAG TPA: LON peptidase substrate-binding domain-containing protein [Gemmataceae bacterium]|jgi:Lon protease-like protein|nr:LON peptidase substrate-binding domain-containing protein [Gemmataceae bacterium]
MSDDQSSLAQFGGVVRLFPLPNVVLFPCAIQGLHIFEPRYRQMTDDALDDDRLITPVLLKPGWETEYHERPAVHAVACLGRIVADHRLPDGRYNLQLRGVSRVRIQEEVENGKLYRSARVQLLADTEPLPAKADQEVRRQLLPLLPAWCLENIAAADALGKLLKSTMPLGGVLDIISFVLPLAMEFKQELLEISSVGLRAGRVLDHLRTQQPAAGGSAADRKWPPDFSTN